MKSCKKGYYYCNTDKKCKEIPEGHHVMPDGELMKDSEHGVDEGWSEKYKKSIDCDNPKGFSQRAHCQGRKKKLDEEGLRKWFKSKSKDGKPGWVDVVDGDACAREKGETATPKCVSSEKRASMSKKERLAAQARKRRKDPNQPDKSGAAKPTYVKTDYTPDGDMDLQEVKDKPGKGSGKKDACYHKVKSRYKVWPSAYASGALVKCRKVGAANWGNSTNEEKDHEVSMAQSQLKKSEKNIAKLRKALGKKEKNIPAWVQAKITDTEHNTDAAAGYMDEQSCPICNCDPCQCLEGTLDEGSKKCWKGYEKKGTQKLFGKTYNRCVKKESVSIEDANGNSFIEFIDLIKPEPLKPSKPVIQVQEGNPSMDINPGAHKKLQKMNKIRNLMDKGTGGEKGAAGAALQRMGGGVNLPLAKKDSEKKLQLAHHEVSNWRAELAEQSPNWPPEGPGKNNSRVKEVNVSDATASSEEIRNANSRPIFDRVMEDWQKVNKSDKTDGMSPAAVKAYRRENPGSKLKTAVTGDPKPGSKDAKRRKSFCARSEGQKDMHNIDCSKDPDKAICKARRRWKC
jgi:hypothetical protein